MKWFKRNKKIVIDKEIAISDEEVKSFLKGGILKKYDKLPEIRKVILQAIVFSYRTTTKNLPTIPFDMFLITDDILEEFKRDFDMSEEEVAKKGGMREHHKRYVEWMNKIGFDYDKNRKDVRKIVRGIYNYTNGQLDYRNRAMLEGKTYKQKRTIEKQKRQDMFKIV